MPFRFAVYGDMGNKNAQSIGRLQKESQQGHFDMILHVGDMAYNLDTVTHLAHILPPTANIVVVKNVSWVVSEMRASRCRRTSADVYTDHRIAHRA